MKSTGLNKTGELTSHFFRNEYGKLVAVITRYLGSEHVETAEDIVQDALLQATKHWDLHGIPDQPKAWLYTTARNLALNALKRRKHQRAYTFHQTNGTFEVEQLPFSEELIEDSQLKMMFWCCHDSIPEHSRIALILKILSGFSISEIANAFFSNKETINKRLVRGRKQLRNVELDSPNEQDLNHRLQTVLKTIYLLFNEGYLPAIKNQTIRFDLCLEAIRLAQLLSDSQLIPKKADIHALLALMYFNVARFKSRVSKTGELMDLREQDRSKWDKELIQYGIQFLDRVVHGNTLSSYALMATISANHCVAASYDKTDWERILSLYDELLLLEQSPIVQLNRCVVLAEVKGIPSAITKLKDLGTQTDIHRYYLYHFTLAEFYKRDQQWLASKLAYEEALKLSENPRDREILKKKKQALVPNSSSQLS
ncbi:RNA polymerase sigma factor [Flagellimonas flava]|uniref:RNA polymerase sigma-70 factor, ECF subfamily n=1 Tax=Flagellimonas flava TaxID=570519 RepID=A0A1M5I2T1_9FLAO|nr:sigma-70 family RNA polymerase sigma factor [Allomuricauda flava]SHG22477.1 RNA polymerase sigma-70 factor, ECF subfamily [Allomuricauda flava]